MNKIILFFNTIKYLKLQQIVYRIYYLLRKRYRKINNFTYTVKVCNDIKHLTLFSFNFFIPSYVGNTFKFLNKDKFFLNSIDWNYGEYGKLWLYNLNYFDYLQQKNISKDDGLYLINDFIDNSQDIKDGMMPFPISLRGMNWIKFITYHHVNDEKINSSLYSQYYILLDNIEYHILGNHLLENGFSLLFGAYYFDDDILHVKAKEILVRELNEQILSDGAHFELSPMYHQMMLFRLLDCINLMVNNIKEKDKEFLVLLQKNASIMLGWLENITFKNGDIPLLNDSANCIAPTSSSLFDYARRLNTKSIRRELKESGYRKIKNNQYECIVDNGNIGPDYILGHAHADTFSFVLYINDSPIIVDRGLSTYESNEIRDNERSTSAHNTVEVNGINQSEVWGGFRVASRAKVIDIKEYDNVIEATHNGYKKYGIFHTRKWEFKEDRIVVKDTLNKSASAIARFHFHPNVKKEEILKMLSVEDNVLEFENYYYSPEFNTYIDGIVVKIKFNKNLKVTFYCIDI